MVLSLSLKRTAIAWKLAVVTEMSQFVDLSSYQEWTCAECGLILVPDKVDLSYLGNSFPVELLRCPKCGLTLIPEELAIGKIAEVEKMVEDK